MYKHKQKERRIKIAILAVFDRDENYNRSLADYISEKQGMPFTTIVFTDKEAFMEYTGEQYIDVLLICTLLMNDTIEKQNIGKIILLSESKIMTEESKYLSIYKYQSAENIIKEVLKYFVNISNNYSIVSGANEYVPIIGVYSPLGRIGKTTFALTLGQILAQQFSTLYINMGEFSAFDKIFRKEYTGDLADLMYFFKQNPEVLPIKLQIIVDNLHGMDYVPPLSFSQDLRNLDTKEWIRLINEISDINAYEMIVLDIGNMVSNVFELLEICNTIYMPVSGDEFSLIKVAAYDEFLLRTDREEIVHRTIKVQMPEFKGGEWSENYLDGQLWGPMGEVVKKMLKEAGINEDGYRYTSGESH